jgi:hypothetical protein
MDTGHKRQQRTRRCLFVELNPGQGTPSVSDKGAFSKLVRGRLSQVSHTYHNLLFPLEANGLSRTALSKTVTLENPQSHRVLL